MLTEDDWTQLLADYSPLDTSPCDQSRGLCNLHFIRSMHFADLLHRVAELVGADPEDDEAVLPNVERAVRELAELRAKLAG